MIGKQIDKYTIISHLGQGGMATVYLAEQINNGNKVAVKVLNSEFLNPTNSNIKNRFIAEAKILIKINHPNIVKVFQLIIQPNVVAYVMEYVPGITLQQLINEKRKFHDIELKEIILKLLKAIGNIHNNNIIHRDIKPSNIIISNTGDLKLVDFGIAKGVGYNSNDYTNTAIGQNMGTPRYMSPEQIKGMKDTTIHTDIYSVGVVIWQMVSGKLPYDCPHYEIQSRVVSEYLPDTYSIWEEIIKKATHKEINKRFKNTDDFCITINQLPINKPNQFSDHINRNDYNDKTEIESDFINDRITKEESNTNTEKKRGNNLRIIMKLTLEDIVNGVEKKIKINRKIRANEGTLIPCSKCFSHGKIRKVTHTIFGKSEKEIQCPKCMGLKKNKPKIVTNGMTVIEEFIDLKIPPGTFHGKQIRVKNKGNENPDSGISGDLIVVFEEIEDEVFLREGYDIKMNLFISKSEASNGVQKTIKTLNGNVRLKIEKGTQNGKVLKLKNKGILKSNGAESGDLLISISIKKENIMSKLLKYIK
jgi:serine/threonine protein kinase